MAPSTTAQLCVVQGVDGGGAGPQSYAVSDRGFNVVALMAFGRDNDPAKWSLRRNLMNAHAEDCLVIGYEPLIDKAKC